MTPPHAGAGGFGVEDGAGAVDDFFEGADGAGDGHGDFGGANARVIDGFDGQDGGFGGGGADDGDDSDFSNGGEDLF